VGIVKLGTLLVFDASLLNCFGLSFVQAPIDDSGRIPRSQRHAVSVPIPTVPDAPPPQILYADVPPVQMGLTDPQV